MPWASTGLTAAAWRGQGDPVPAVPVQGRAGRGLPAAARRALARPAWPARRSPCPAPPPVVLALCSSVSARASLRPATGAARSSTRQPNTQDPTGRSRLPSRPTVPRSAWPVRQLAAGASPTARRAASTRPAVACCTTGPWSAPSWTEARVRPPGRGGGAAAAGGPCTCPVTTGSTPLPGTFSEGTAHDQRPGFQRAHPPTHFRCPLREHRPPPPPPASPRRDTRIPGPVSIHRAGRLADGLACLPAHPGASFSGRPGPGRPAGAGRAVRGGLVSLCVDLGPRALTAP